ncbi:MAG: hypothetical protein CSB48_10925 [Proteobacteria bacterium]|nr:MAG: hypothetical protein CSB48_10925 [Pseudomonadota bacterium]
MFLAAALLAPCLSLPAFADNRPVVGAENHHSVVLGSFQIRFKVKKSTIDTIPFRRLDEIGLSDAYLPGAFEATAAGEVERVVVVSESRENTRAGNLTSDTLDQNLETVSLVRAVASIHDPYFSRSNGNVTGISLLTSTER